MQNILAFRFANAVLGADLEPPVHRPRADHRGGGTSASGTGASYYDEAGALRDMVQNHLLQLRVPHRHGAAGVVRRRRDPQQEGGRAPRHPADRPKEVGPGCAVRGQYGAEPDRRRSTTCPAIARRRGWTPDPHTETFAALKLFVDNWRWQDVPFYLRTGKRLPTRVSEISLQFRPVPHQPFPAAAVADLQPNRLVIRIQPDEGIWLQIRGQAAGAGDASSARWTCTSVRGGVPGAPPDAYETLLLDVMRGDQTLFMRADQEEAAWSVLMPVLENWAEAPAGDFPNYAAGTWGPEGADRLLAADGRSWCCAPPSTDS